MQLRHTFNKGFCPSFYVIDIFSKNAWVSPLKYKKALNLLKLFKKKLITNQTKYGKTKAVIFKMDQ